MSEQGTNQEPINTQIKHLCPELCDNEIDRYLTMFRRLKDSQRNHIQSLLSKIKDIFGSNPPHAVIDVIGNLVRHPVCFTGQKEALEQLLEHGKCR